MNKNYINLIAELLKAKGWTQSELAHELQVTFATLSRWINGHATPQKAHLQALKRQHREWVGLPTIPIKDYQQLLKRASACGMKRVTTCLAQNAALQREFVVDGTYNSNTIEGTTLNLRETEVVIYDHQAVARPLVDQLLTANHAAILKDIFNGAAFDVSEVTIREMHKRLFQGVRDDAGNYSKFKRGIVGLNIQLPYPEDVPEEMAGLMRRLNQGPGKMHALEFVAQTHASFELIHPFGDGNGRIGRLIMTIQCLNFGYPPIIIENARKAEYYEALEHAQRRSIDQLLQFLVEELERAHDLVKKYER